MDVIEPKDETEKGPEPVATDGATMSPEKKPSMRFAINKEGVLTLEADLETLMLDAEEMLRFRGWMDNSRDVVLGLMNAKRNEREQKRRQILMAKNSNGMRGFINKITGR